jgi:hypothetical protein
VISELLLKTKNESKEDVFEFLSEASNWCFSTLCILSFCCINQSPHATSDDISIKKFSKSMLEQHLSSFVNNCVLIKCNPYYFGWV